MLMKIFYLEGNSKKVTSSHPVVEVIHQQGENMDENQMLGIERRNYHNVGLLRVCLEYTMKCISVTDMK